MIIKAWNSVLEPKDEVVEPKMSKFEHMRYATGTGLAQ
jgi:hypothetical protein